MNFTLHCVLPDVRFFFSDQPIFRVFYVWNVTINEDTLNDILDLSRYENFTSDIESVGSVPLERYFVGLGDVLVPTGHSSSHM